MAARSAASGPATRAVGSESRSISADGCDEGLLWGVALVTFGCVSFAFFVCARSLHQSRLKPGSYAYVAAPFMPDTGFRLLDAIKHDDHYNPLLPLLWPVSLIFVIVNWGSLKFWRQAAAT